MSSREFYYAMGDELIAKAKEQMRLDKIEGKTSKIKFMIEFLLDENGMKYSDIEIREHIFTLLSTGGETSANVLANAILYLAIKQDIQDELYSEIKDVFGSDDIGHDLEYEAINKLQLLDRVIKETLRYYPIGNLTVKMTVLNSLPGYMILYPRKFVQKSTSCSLHMSCQTLTVNIQSF